MITKDNAKQWLPLVRAMAEGKTIQVRGDMGGWFDVVSGCLTDLRDGVARYRIKPEPKLRPWKAEEAPLYFMVRNKVSARLFVACKQYGYDHVRVWNQTENGVAYGMHELFEQFMLVREDGTEHPCGVLCEGEEHGEA